MVYAQDKQSKMLNFCESQEIIVRYLYKLSVYISGIHAHTCPERVKATHSNSGATATMIFRGVITQDS